MQGIDISSHQTGIDLAKVPCDFVIIKATQGTSYVNPDLNRQYTQALVLGKQVGLYHYASQGGSTEEARHFVDTVKKLDAIGKAILVLDWESGSNANWGNTKYAKAFMDYVLARTKVTPFIYMSKSVCREYDWSDVAAKYPLWVAQYKNYKYTGYQTNPWTDKYGYGAWSYGPYIFQYTSVGRLNGWNDNLDLDISYLSAEEWYKWCVPDGKGSYSKPVEGNTGIDTSNYPLTKYGHKNAWVKLLQNALEIRGYSVGPDDGVFGTTTLKAVKQFQKDFNLVVDGVVGTNTWFALFNK